MLVKNVLLGAAALFAAASPALASGYEITPIGEKGTYFGCTAINTETDVAFVAVGNTLSVMVTSKEFDVKKGDKVSGTWSVDGGKEHALEKTANGSGTVSSDMEPTKANFQIIGDGKEMTVTVGKESMVFDMSGSQKALIDLSACMNKISGK